MKKGVNRYSVVCAKQGCIESRAHGLKEARRIGKDHLTSGCKAQVTIYHWTANDELKPGRAVETLP